MSEMNVEQKYKHPPIVEAVMEFRFAEPIAVNILEKLEKKISKECGFIFKHPAAILFPLETNTGFRLSNSDQTDIIAITPKSLIIARNAPYQGWEEFLGQAKKIWTIWKKTRQTNPIARVGVRFINRLDIPTETNKRVKISDFLNCYLHIPEDGKIDNQKAKYFFQFSTELEDTGFKLNLSSASIDSPLLNYASFLLDIDITKDNPIYKDEELWKNINQIRILKNKIFESYITDKARELFNE